MATDDLAAFVAAHPPRRFSADQMIGVWEGLASLSEVTAIATDDPGEHGVLKEEAAFRRQLAAAVRWVQAQHGREVADAFVTYLGDASSGMGSGTRP